MSKLRFFLILLLALGAGTNSFAQVDIKNTKVLILPVDQSEPILSAENSLRLQPKKMAPGDSSQSVMMEMIDNSVSLLWEKSAIKTTAVGQVADKVEKNLKTEVSLGRSADKKIEHKISVKLLAMQALAKIEYKGWVRAGLNYDARAAKTEAELIENLSEHNELALTQSVTAIENKSQVSFRWNW